MRNFELDFDVNSFKTKVIDEILENNEIIYLLDKNYIDCGGGLLNKKLFPFMQNPKTIEDTSPFICFKVDHEKNDNCFIEDIYVVIYIICHEKEMTKKVESYETKQVRSGTVIDIIGEEIKAQLTGLDTNWIGRLSLEKNIEEVLYYEYPCRILTFKARKEAY